MKGQWKKRFAQIFFILLTILLLVYFDAALCFRSEHGVNQARAMYFQPRNSIDVVMMGSSHIHCDIDPGLLWEQYGIASYDYSAAEQTLWFTYYYLQELCRYQSPRLIVLDLHAPARYRSDYQYDFILENFCGMRFSLNKLRMIAAGIEPDRLKEFIPSFATYHGRALSLSAEDFLFPFTAAKEFRSFKGYTPYLGNRPTEPPHLYDSAKLPLTEKSERYLRKIIEDTKARGIELFLIVTPYPDADAEEPTFNWIGDLARDEGVPFADYNYHTEWIGLDFEQDFFDESHLNHWGARKFTEYFGGQLTEQYDLPDHRGEAGYESWEENFTLVNGYVSANG